MTAVANKLSDHMIVLSWCTNRLLFPVRPNDLLVRHWEKWWTFGVCTIFIVDPKFAYSRLISFGNKHESPIVSLTYVTTGFSIALQNYVSFLERKFCVCVSVCACVHARYCVRVYMCACVCVCACMCCIVSSMRVIVTNLAQRIKNPSWLHLEQVFCYLRFTLLHTETPTWVYFDLFILLVTIPPGNDYLRSWSLSPQLSVVV